MTCARNSGSKLWLLGKSGQRKKTLALPKPYLRFRFAAVYKPVFRPRHPNDPRGARVKLRLLLIVLLAFAGMGYGSGPQAKEKPKIQLEHPVNPHLDIPKNCQTVVEPDNSVILTCECEQCGKIGPEDRAQVDPDPWVCKTKDGGLYCNYDLDTQTAPERWHSRI
jgi:hypothetical protein